MKYKLLGDTGMRVSELCLGTMTFGRESSTEESRRIFDMCRDAGVNFIDTANIYAGTQTESLLGSFLEDSRHQWILATKARYPVGDKGPNDRGASRRHLRLSVESSLRRLRTDWIDLFFVHGFDQDTALEETMRTLDDLVREGKILSIGVSNFSAWQTMKAQGIALRHGWSTIQVIQPMYSLLKRQAEVELLPMALSEGLSVMPYSPLGAGILTGKYANPQKKEEARLDNNTMYQKRYPTHSFTETAAQFTALAQELKVTPAALAIAWVAAHPAVTSPILGARHTGQMEQCLKATQIEMTQELYNRIASFSPTPPPATDRLEERVP